MSEEKKPYKISQIYQHPKTGAIVVHFEFPELGYRNNINFNPVQFEDMNKAEIKAEIQRALENHYQEKKRQRENVAFKGLIDVVATEMAEK